MSAASRSADEPLEVVVGLLRDRAGRVLVSQRPPGRPFAGWWEFPGGKRRSGETAWAALGRELDEELGIRVLGGKRALEYYYAYPERTVHLDVWWIASYAGEPEPRESQILAWVPPRELAERKLLAADGPIVETLLVAPLQASRARG